MTNTLAWTVSALLAFSAGCGASRQAQQCQKEGLGLHQDLAVQKQYNADLKRRIHMVDARNKVLIDLVHGLTSRAEQGDAADAEHGPAHASLAALDRDLDALVASVQHSRDDMEAQRAQRQALSDQLAQAKQIIESSRAEEAKVSARVQAFRDVRARLTDLIDSGQLELRVLRNRMAIQLPEAALFESGGVNITQSGKAELDRVAEGLRAAADRDFQIGGHTDSTQTRGGRFASNWQLSAVRAVNVMLYLIDRGIPKARLSAAAYADTQPLADDSTPEGRKANRRIEIVLLPTLEELPNLAGHAAEATAAPTPKPQPEASPAPSAVPPAAAPDAQPAQ